VLQSVEKIRWRVAPVVGEVVDGGLLFLLVDLSLLLLDCIDAAFRNCCLLVS